MTKQRVIRGGALLAACLACALLMQFPSVGQDRQPASGEKAPAAEKDGATKKFRGRLPNYFSAVVTPKQREEIYRLQGEYAAKIAELEAQLEMLLAERDKAVDDVLEPEQLATVNKQRDEAKKRRDARFGKSKAEAQEP